ncbi:MAG TPA: glycosyltransferase family 4 protein [Blastocatellia bacterium]|nr:glycosyltransferase family 4 protein [Blastocatellia bacterium]
MPALPAPLNPGTTTLKHSNKPTVLLLTSSFPRSPDDETCGYIRDFARSLSVDFNVTVLAPPDRSAVQWPPDVFTLTRSRSALPRRLDPLQAGADLNHLTSGSPLAKLAALVSLVCFFVHALALAVRADAVCSQWMVPTGLVGALICRLLGKPHVVVEHSGALHLLARMRGGRRIARLVVEGSDWIVTVSADLNRKLIALCPEAENKVEVIPMGVTDSSPYPETVPTRQSNRMILFIGRLTEIKGLDVLLRAMDGLDDSRLIVAGDGERRDELEGMSRALSVNTRFVGRIGASQREQLLSTCDAVVIPSRVLADGRTEGMPVVCLEAMAAGRAVVASRVGGLAEVIVDGENGLLFERGDDQMLKEKLSLVLSDDSLRRKIAGNARRSAAAYDWARIGLRYSRIIKSALRKNDAVGNRRGEASSIHG